MTTGTGQPTGAVRGRRRIANSAGVATGKPGVVIKHTDEEFATVPRLLAGRLALAGDGGRSRLIAAVSNNVNQIAVAANATGEVGESLEATLDAVRRVAARVDGVVRAVEEEGR